MECRGLKWTDERLVKAVSGKKRLSSLDLFGTSVTDAGLQHVAERFSLRSFHLSSDVVTAEGVRGVLASPQLRSCMLTRVPAVGDEIFADLSACTDLAELYLEGTGITDQGIGAIVGLPKLWSLVIKNTAITDAGISSIGSSSVNLLSFQGCHITGRGFHTWDCHEKFSLYGDDSAMDAGGFTVAAKHLHYLWNVHLSNTDLDDEAIRQLSRPGPTSLRIDGTRVTKDGVVWLYEHTEVQDLTISSGILTEDEIGELNQREERSLLVYEVFPETDED